ncbi:MAG: serine/threonine-protein kinase, partial [Acidobacteriota bacterium]
MDPTPSSPIDRPESLSTGGLDDRAVSPRGRLGALMQRLFYPDQFQKEQIFLDLIEDLGRCRDVAELAQDVGQGLDQALQPRNIHVFVRHERRFRLVWSTDRPVTPPMLVPDEFVLLREAATWREPRPLASAPSLTTEERQWFRAFGTAWVVPLAHPTPSVGLVGLALLGERRDGYSTVQRDLLQTLASRMAVRVVELVLAHQRQLLTDQGNGTWLKECPACHRCFASDACYCPDDDTVLEPTILVDPLVDGRYLLERRLGSGGMGAVYRAIDRDTETTVALKVLAGGDRIALGRFENEAQAGKVIRHPNITQVLDSGRLGRQGAFMVMEYVEGQTLREAMDAEMPVAPERVARWFDQILAGVAAAHGDGVIHR